MDLRVGTKTPRTLNGNALASAYTHSATLSVDVTAPTVTAYSVDQSSLTLTFSETMDSGKAATEHLRCAGGRQQPQRKLLHAVRHHGGADPGFGRDPGSEPSPSPTPRRGTGTVLEDAAGNPLANISATSVSNVTDTTVPTVTFKLGTNHADEHGHPSPAQDDNIVLEFSEPVYSDSSQDRVHGRRARRAS